MLSTKPRILATAAVLTALVMAAGTSLAQLTAQPSAPAPPVQVAQVQPPAVPAASFEDGEST
jgi:hypothetical protein